MSLLQQSITKLFANDKWSRTAGITGGALGLVALLAMKYNDRIVFDTYRKNTYHHPGKPLIGSTFDVFANLEEFDDYILSIFDAADTLTVSISAVGLPVGVHTIDPAVIEHILKNNFENYVKGEHFHNSTVDVLGHGIFNANGENWKWQRKAASIIFNVKNFRDHFTEVFVDELELVNKIFDKVALENQVVDFQDVMYKFTLDSFVLISFGTNVNALTTDGKVPFAEAFDEMQKNSFERFMNPFEFVQRRANEIFRPWKPTMGQYKNTIDSFVDDIIQRRRQELTNGGEFKDLLSRFMNSKNDKNEPLTDVQLRDAVINILLAGRPPCSSMISLFKKIRDTTAGTLAWMLYYLCTHPEVEAKLMQEIQENVPFGLEQDPPALYEAIKSMKYAHAVLYETLRLSPVVPVNQKTALKDDVLPDGTPLKAGETVVWHSYGVGRCKKIWGPDAREYKPSRWFTPDGDLRRESQGKWPAFHAGPRVCLGQNLAILETLVAMSLLLRRYKFTMVPDQHITYQISLTMPMKYGIKVTVAPRD
ncbi:cytochrome P450 [Hesseltinella vesiculosa]|uniref:Cytochrome P450 n=1 Tax=Hesseltinella vesiculosa TaxID=101127 RepID=A0A1X2GV66_9FUNG|nr:cytochrome P450 [Hesseltinella vesiculosa]